MLVDWIQGWTTVNWTLAASLAAVCGAWLMVSFVAPGSARDRLVWLGVVAMYASGVSFFWMLLRDALDEGGALSRGVFGFLAALFSAGLLLSLWRAVRALGSDSERGVRSATH